MNAIAFASTSGTNVQALHEAAKDNGYVIRAVFCDKKCGAMERAEKQLGLPVIYESGVRFCGRWSDAYKAGKTEDYLKKCEDYETVVVDKLNDFAKEHDFDIDFIFLAGYMRIVRDTLLKAFPDKMANVHPGHLGLLDDNHKRVYDGDNAVMKAIAAGEQQTYSTVHLATGVLDGGEMIVLSKPYKVDAPADIIDIIQYTKAEIEKKGCIDTVLSSFSKDSQWLYEKFEDFCGNHQDGQKVNCDWPAFTLAAKLIAQGRVKIGTKPNTLGVRNVYIDDRLTGYEGYEM